jgi:hypothetical protein
MLKKLIIGFTPVDSHVMYLYRVKEDEKERRFGL